MGAGYAPFAVLTFLLDGVPMIYNGQEINLDRRLLFFERDPIVWPKETHPTAKLYQVMTKLRRENTALHTGSPMRRLDTTDNATFYVVERSAGAKKVVGIFNLTAKDSKADLYDAALTGKWTDAFTGETVELNGLVPLDMKGWRYRVLVQ